jgi:DNA-binding CsgD family transcriptional regulator
VKLQGRHLECEVLDQLVAAVRKGKSQALVVRGEPGVGKTVLLDHLVGQAHGCRVTRAVGVQSELEFAFAGLHQLCAPLLDRDEGLPAPQREALRTAFGLSAGPAPDRFLVGLAVLGLLAEVARERPLVCVVDDAQWLDQASVQALAFVARRLVAESVALVVAVRQPGGVAGLDGLAELVVMGLPDEEARELARSVLPGPVDERVLDRLVAETRGNPLALLELPRGLMWAELAGGFGVPGGRPLPGRIEESFQQRLAPLEPQTRRLLLLAAIESLGDPVLLWRAAERLGIGITAAGPAADADLLEIGARVRFRHPLVRSAVYRAAAPEERRDAHRALAEVLDPAEDPDRRAWHAAHAAPEPDENVAAELERSAGRAQARGGLAAAAAFLRRAAELTPGPDRRAQRTLDAAHATYQAGVPDAALRLLAIAEATSLDEVQRARVALLRAQIAFAVNRGGDAAAALLHAAQQLEPFDVPQARETYLEALAAAMFAGPLGGSESLSDVGRAARAAPPPRHPPGPPDLLLDGLAVRFTDGYAAAMPALRRAVAAFHGPDLTLQDGLRWLWLAHVTAVDIWGAHGWEQLAARHDELVRDSGALSMLPLAQSMHIGTHVFLGELTSAASLVDELDAVTRATGSHIAPYGALILAAWVGHEAEATALIDATRGEVLRRGEGIGLVFAEWARAVLYNGHSRWQDALAAAQAATEHRRELGAPTWGALVELVEAATRLGHIDLAAEALDRLTTMTRAGDTDWALGLEARSRALHTDGAGAERAYSEAIERLCRTPVRGELARAHLVYGEWLRRRGRRLDAREQLRNAHQIFTAAGAEAFAQRTARELLAAGEHVRKSTAPTGAELTPQEAQIARLVRDGLTNPEIGARLFLSPRTVEWHLSKIFGKLGIASRRDLRQYPISARRRAGNDGTRRHGRPPENGRH